VFYTEARLGSLIPIGKGDVPKLHWYRMTRTPPAGGHAPVRVALRFAAFPMQFDRGVHGEEAVDEPPPPNDSREPGTDSARRSG
jgi:hypothetical protein